jgi:uncharacterized protein YyaL (SSP411 family)
VSSLERAGRWFLDSGIQEPSGGVARFYLADSKKNKPVSTEITGYTASALMFFYASTGQEEYLDRARLTARFLCEHAWDPALRIFPYEHPSPSGESDHLGYFFDSGIIVRGLLSVWRVTREDQLLETAIEAAKAMLSAFRTDDGFHPILALPNKMPLPRRDHWSRTVGCYQAKSAMAWLEVGEIAGDNAMRDAYFQTIDEALCTHRAFLPGASDSARVMDRLHAYCYFLEALTPVLDRAACAEAYRYGVAEVSRHVREIRASFIRSDVYAQLLRARLCGAAAIPVDLAAAAEEARWLEEFQAQGHDARIQGGFYFGRRDGAFIPHVNPVSTAFAAQALELCGAHQSNGAGGRSPSPI